MFTTPVTSNCGGLYVAFQIPEGSEYGHEGAGGGFGMGYLAGDGVRRCWLSGNGIDWNPMVSSVCLAVEPVLSTEKAGRNVLVLEAPGAGAAVRQERGGDSAASLSAYPNPFNPESTIVFDLPNSGAAKVEIFDVRGRKVRTLFSGILTAGSHTVQWEGSDDSGASVASGVYFVRLGSRGIDATRRIVLVK